MTKTIPLTPRELFPLLPIDNKLKPHYEGEVFTLADGFGSKSNSAPAYPDPRHLACWLLGYISAHVDMKEGEK